MLWCYIVYNANNFFKIFTNYNCTIIINCFFSYLFSR